ncbi:hypothetical protein TNCV_4384941 [Trichonephila clavipes]|nr:hypothetical protein TNCV_4384941 [Trichonephila clavipes]
MLWSRQQSAFAVESYFSSGRSAITVQRAYQRLFDIPPRVPVPDRKCVLMSMDAFRATVNVEQARESIQTSMWQGSNNSYPFSQKEILTTCSFNKKGPQPTPPGFPWMF